MEISTQQVKELRDRTGISIMACKKALEETGGDMDKALAVIQQKSGETAKKKQDRELGSGIIQSYIHTGGSVGVLLELSCETDFVSKNEEFKVLAYDIAMHIAASSPLYLSKEDISKEDQESVEEMFAKDLQDKPEDVRKKALQGKIDSHFSERTLLDQSFVKNSDITIQQLIEQAVQKFGERIKVSKFERFVVGH